MPVNLPNFLQANTQRSPFEGLLESAIEGYKASRLPSQMRTEEQRQSELVKQLQHGNYRSGLENEYLPHELENKRQTEDINLEFLRPEKEIGLQGKHADLAGKLLSNEDQRMKNEIQEKFGLSEAEADLLFKRAQTKEAEARSKYAHLAHLTPEQRNAEAIYGMGTPGYNEHLKLQAGIRPHPVDETGNPLPLPANAHSLVGMGVNERNHAVERMTKDIARGEAAQLANNALDGIQEIITEFPKLNRSLSYIIADPNSQSAYARAVKGLNEKEQTALDLLQKYSAQLALHQSETGNQRATNFYRQMVRETKPGVGMTIPAMTRISSEIREANVPLINYSNKAAPFLHSYDIPYQAKNFQDKAPAPSIDKALRDNGPNGESKALVSVKVGKKLFNIPLSDVDEFMEEFKDQNPTIQLGGK